MKELPDANTDKTTNETEPPSYLDITFSQKGISEFRGNRRVVFVSRDEVVRIESKIGSRAERPLVQGIAGFLLGCLGGYGIYMVMQAGLAFVRWEAGFIVFGGIGVWLLIEAFRQGHYLLVTCAKDVRKLVFDGKVNEPEIKEFLAKAERLGYDCR